MLFKIEQQIRIVSIRKPGFGAGKFKVESQSIVLRSSYLSTHTDVYPGKAFPQEITGRVSKIISHEVSTGFRIFQMDAHRDHTVIIDKTQKTEMRLAAEERVFISFFGT